jgi:hypothetical protein
MKKPTRAQFESQEQYEEALINFGRSLKDRPKKAYSMTIDEQTLNEFLAKVKSKKLKITDVMEAIMSKYINE